MIMARMIMARMIMARMIVARVIVARVIKFVYRRTTSRMTVVSVAQCTRTALVRQQESCRNHKSKADG